MAAAGVAQANRELVADQLAAAAGENGWTAGEACPLLLAAFGREPSDEAAVWEYGAADHGAARGKRVQDSSKVRMIVNRLQGIVLCPNPWSLHVSEQTGEQRRCQSSNHAVEGSKEVISLSSQLV